MEVMKGILFFTFFILIILPSQGGDSNEVEHSLSNLLNLQDKNNFDIHEYLALSFKLARIGLINQSEQYFKKYKNLFKRNIKNATDFKIKSLVIAKNASKREALFSEFKKIFFINLMNAEHGLKNVKSFQTFRNSLIHDNPRLNDKRNKIFVMLPHNHTQYIYLTTTLSTMKKVLSEYLSINIIYTDKIPIHIAKENILTLEYDFTPPKRKKGDVLLPVKYENFMKFYEFSFIKIALYLKKDYFNIAIQVKQLKTSKDSVRPPPPQENDSEKR